MDRRGYDKYRENQIRTASQSTLIMMLFDGAIRFVNYAVEALPMKKYDVVNNNLIKAQDIVMELILSLNMSVGEISAGLYAIYDFLYKHLVNANVKKDPKIMQECLELLAELRDMWNQVIKSADKT
jgi:flagellar secretion chaperone FliS